MNLLISIILISITLRNLEVVEKIACTASVSLTVPSIRVFTALEVGMIQRVFFLSCIALVLTVFVACQAESKTGIPEKIGGWRVEVGPPGNDFYEAPAPAGESSPPSEAMFEMVRRIAPDYTEVKRWELQNGDRYFIRAETDSEEYDFRFSLEGVLLELEYENDLTVVEETPGALIITGTRESMPMGEVPTEVLQTLSELFPEVSPSEAWRVSTAAGPRFAIVLEGQAFFSRPDGQIQAIGSLEDGALDEVDPPDEMSSEKIRADAAERLGPYHEKFNFEKQIGELGNGPGSTDGQYRFVILGDSRSNPDLWPNIIEHIDLLDPKPDFVINTGDIVRHGYTDEFLDYYIPPLLETDIPHFIALGNHDDGDSGLAVEYQILFGPNSLNYYFDYGSRRFIMIDNVTKVLPYRETLAWLEKVLEETPPDLSIIVAAHKPIANEKWAYHSWDEENSQVFSDLMTKHEVEHVFFGHIHAYSTAQFQGIAYTIAGGGGAGLHNRYGPTGNVHHYIICDVQPDGSIRQQVVRFYRGDEEPAG